MPTVCNKKHCDTYRIFFKRREKLETAKLVIVLASHLFLRIEEHITYPDKREEKCYIRKETIEFLANLTKTCQVALLVDYPNQENTRWAVQKLILAEMRLQFDAIYIYNTRQSAMKLDI